jgi:hypothetical protein
MIELESVCLFVICNGAEEFWAQLKLYDKDVYTKILYAAQDETAKELDAIRNRTTME